MIKIDFEPHFRETVQELEMRFWQDYQMRPDEIHIYIPEILKPQMKPLPDLSHDGIAVRVFFTSYDDGIYIYPYQRIEQPSLGMRSWFREMVLSVWRQIEC